MEPMLLTLLTSQPLMSPLNALASSNMKLMPVTLLTSQLLMS